MDEFERTMGLALYGAGKALAWMGNALRAAVPSRPGRARPLQEPVAPQISSVGLHVMAQDAVQSPAVQARVLQELEQLRANLAQRGFASDTPQVSRGRGSSTHRVKAGYVLPVWLSPAREGTADFLVEYLACASLHPTKGHTQTLVELERKCSLLGQHGNAGSPLLAHRSYALQQDVLVGTHEMRSRLVSSLERWAQDLASGADFTAFVDEFEQAVEP